MKNRKLILSYILAGPACAGVLLILACSPAYGQLREGPIKIFGYYQNAFEFNVPEEGQNSTTFLLQQLNFIAQKDIAPRFRSFVSFEFLNTFESSLRWGSASLKEAWVRYDAGHLLKLKIGLQIPVFNELNEIKARSPLLPYIVRPIVYETSLEEIIRIEDFVPEQAFLQAYGSFFSKSNLGLDYAVFVGNSPNVNNNEEFGQTGVDTTAAILVGGRIGLHLNNFDSDFSEIKLGVSSTYERIDLFTGVEALLFGDTGRDGQQKNQFAQIPRYRFGGDLTLYWKKLYLQSEVISVIHNENSEQLDVDKYFVYGTLGFIQSEKFEGYVSYWRTKEFGVVRDRRVNPRFLIDQFAELDIYTVGAKYSLTPRVVLKAQYAWVDVDNREELNVVGVNGLEQGRTTVVEDTFSVYALALSVFF